jgi:flavin-dependent dehydrogenase
MLVGDAAGLAYPQSGEGIRPAIESGLIAASVIIRANRQYTRTRLEPYDAALRARLFAPMSSLWSSRAISGRLARALTPRLFAWPTFVRRVLLERAFLRSRDSALV